MGEIFLVRHGQVAFGGASYDGLSPLGEEQAAAVGRALGQRGVAASRLMIGSMDRHRQTAQLASRAAEWSAPTEVHGGWDEFDHVAILAAAGDMEPDRSLSGPDTLRRFFGVAIPRWSSGLHDDDYAETFGAFSARVMCAFQQLREGLATEDTAVVFTSAGVIGWVTASLLDVGEQQWLSLIPVGVNSGVSRIQVTGDSATLVSYNEHAHLGPGLVTYR